MSKLPKFSQTDAPPPPAQDAPMQTGSQPMPAQPMPAQAYGHRHSQPQYSPDYSQAPPAPGGPEAWMSAGMGLLLLILNPRIIQFITSPGTFDQKWKFTDKDGVTLLKFTQTVFFWSDLAITLFAIVMIADALVLLKARNRKLVAAALALTVLTVLLNAGYIVYTFNEYGIPIMSVIAILYGGYIAIYEWRLLNQLSMQERAHASA